MFLVESSALELVASAGYPKHYSGDEDCWIVQLWHTSELWRNFVRNQTTSQITWSKWSSSSLLTRFQQLSKQQLYLVLLGVSPTVYSQESAGT